MVLDLQLNRGQRIAEQKFSKISYLLLDLIIILNYFVKVKPIISISDPKAPIDISYLSVRIIRDEYVPTSIKNADTDLFLRFSDIYYMLNTFKIHRVKVKSTY